MKRFKQVIAILLSACMLAGTAACGPTTASLTPATPDESVVESVSESVSENVPEVEEDKRIDDNGKPIADFDEFVNEDWLEVQRSSGVARIYPQDEMRKVIRDRIDDILGNTDLSTLSPDDDLYKVITIYRQVADRSENPAKIEAIKEYLSKIEKVKKLNDIYALLRDERYFCNNILLNFTVDADNGGSNALYLKNLTLAPTIDNLIALLETAENSEAMDGLLIRMKDLGYSSARIKEILENSLKVDGYIDEYISSDRNDKKLHYFNPKLMENRGVNVPILDIFVDLGIAEEGEGFLAENACDEFLNTLFTEENTPAIRDYLIFTSVLTFSVLSDFDRSSQMPDEYYTATARQMVMSFTPDVLLEEYKKRYLDDSVTEEVAALLEEVKAGAVEVVYDTGWLSTHGKELARRKILQMREAIGENTDSIDLSNLEISDNAIENYLSLAVLKKRFDYSHLSEEDAERELYGNDMFDVNAKYFSQLNAFYVCAGLLSEYEETIGESYEEKLGHVGRIMAHEISHAYDPEKIPYDFHGWYEPWLTEEEQAEYDKEIKAITDFFDGKKDEYGREIKGTQIAAETYADILAVKICLHILSQKEDADYDKFFRTYAKDQTMYYTADGANIPPENGYLPGKMRVNYVLGQFDKFYETYDIDENSPFFVPEGERIELFR